MVGINIALELFCSILSLILIVCLVISEDRNTKLSRLFVQMLAVNIGVLLSDAVTFILRGSTAPYARIVLHIANFCVYSLGYIILGIFTNYLVSYIGQRSRISRKIVHVVAVGCALAVLLVLISQFNHMYYYFDENNLYQRGSLYWLSQVWAIVLMVFNELLVILYRKSLNRRELVSLMSYGLLPVIAMLIQIRFYGLTLLYMGTTLAMLIIYVSVQLEQSHLLKQKEQELTESRISTMLSQIQPHFLYNTLVVIKQLCDINPQEAKEAITDFSHYLRGNLDSLAQKRLIMFEQEMHHVKTYLSLEQKRFEEKLDVVWDVEARDFSLPALTLQPIVENAVRYGVTKREEGGTIWISTREEEDGWRIEVRDNGVGFDPAQRVQDGRSHIGIENVNSRLGSMCRGSLELQSTPGVGTTVQIHIPKGGGAE